MAVEFLLAHRERDEGIRDADSSLPLGRP